MKNSATLILVATGALALTTTAAPLTQATPATPAPPTEAAAPRTTPLAKSAPSSVWSALDDPYGALLKPPWATSTQTWPALLSAAEANPSPAADEAAPGDTTLAGSGDPTVDSTSPDGIAGSDPTVGGTADGSAADAAGGGRGTTGSSTDDTGDTAGSSGTDAARGADGAGADGISADGTSGADSSAGADTVDPDRPATSPMNRPDKPQNPLDDPPPPGIGAEALEVGPSQAPPCTGVRITPDQNAAEIVDNHPTGTAFCFAAGLHRITRTIEPKANQILASDQGAVLTGSIQLTTWTPTGGDWLTRGVLPPAYPRTGQCEDNVANICHLREQVFVNGKHLKRVSTRDKVVPGTFFGDYTNNVVYVGDDPAGKSVEMSKTATAIQSPAGNVTVRGLTVEHFATPPQGGAVVLGPNWKVSANEIRWNHAVGTMLVNADGAILEKNLIHHNGQLGVGQYSTVNGAITGNEIRNNNTDGFWIADWESGGIKTTWSTGGSVTRNLIKANKGVGLWSDAYDDGRTFANNDIVDNAADGIRYEIGRNGTIESNLITGNGLGTGRGSGTSLWDGGGINVNTSVNVQVRNNRVADNVNGISIQSRTRGSGPWGLNLLRDVVVTGNQVTMKGGTTATGMVQNSGAAIPAGEVTLRTNTYILDSLTANRFQKFGQWFTAPEWRRTGQDTDSKFTTR